jgi:dihydrolipoamide dehydrogenase
MTKSFSYDGAILGAGIGGYVAAIRLSQLGKKVVLIEKDKLGGMCLNWGCIPTKSLIATTDLLKKMKGSAKFGIYTKNIEIDFEKIIIRVNNIVKRLLRGVNSLIRKNNIFLIEGEGKILSKNKLFVKKKDGNKIIIKAENIIIATGTEDPRPYYTEIDQKKVLTAQGVLSLKKPPKNLTIIGGNTFGIEFAKIFKALGSDVQILNATSRLLSTLDKDLSFYYERILKKDEIQVFNNVKVKFLKFKQNGRN